MADKDQYVTSILADADTEIVHNLEDTPGIYIDGAQGFSVINGVAKFQLFRVSQVLGETTPEAGFKKVIVAQIILPPSIVGSLAQWLALQAKGLEAKAERESAEDSDSSDGGR